MSPVVTFETPENIPVSYPLAGPGTRFIAFIFDTFIILVGLLILFLVSLILVLVFADANAMPFSGDVVIAGLTVFVGFVFIGYFGVSEWLMNGVTIGKAALRIRVVMADGFSLSFTGVLVRTLFRLIDVIPLLWVVPVVTAREQRFGDMAGGTIVVSEVPAPMHAVRTQLAERPVSEADYVFSATQLAAMTPEEVEAIETFLVRRDALIPEHRRDLAARLTTALSTRIGYSEPLGSSDHERFLEDLLAAYARKESRDVA